MSRAPTREKTQKNKSILRFEMTLLQKFSNILVQNDSFDIF